MSHNLSQLSTNGEAALVGLLAKSLSASGCRVRLEVSNMGQSVDIVATRGRWVTFIEAKMKDWRRALEQCRAHENIADFICVAVSLKKAPQDLISRVQERGYGLFLCNTNLHKCDLIVWPRRNKRVWVPQRRKVSAAMKDVPYAY